MLAEFDDAPEVQALIEILQNEDDDIRQGLHEHLASLQSDVGDAGLSWLAVYSDQSKTGNITDWIHAFIKRKPGII